MAIRFLVLAIALAVSGCATVSPVAPPLPPAVPGIYHKVERGQTLWRISRIYDQDLEELASINHIQDSASIEVGQLIFIPHAKKPQPAYKTSPTEEFIWPVKGRVVSSYGQQFNGMFNSGLTIQAEQDSEIIASRSGRVVFFAPDFSSFGNTLIIDHEDGFSTVYCLSSAVSVKVGDIVRQGAVIARTGSAGRKTKNSYLHFQVRKGYSAQNPMFYLP